MRQLRIPDSCVIKYRFNSRKHVAIILLFWTHFNQSVTLLGIGFIVSHMFFENSTLWWWLQRMSFIDVHKSLIKLLLHWYNGSIRYRILIYFSRNKKIDNNKKSDGETGIGLLQVLKNLKYEWSSKSFNNNPLKTALNISKPM